MTVTKRLGYFSVDHGGFHLSCGWGDLSVLYCGVIKHGGNGIRVNLLWPFVVFCWPARER
jgi:hypothetical protein